MNHAERILVLGALVLSLFTFSCKKFTSLADDADSGSNQVILHWNEIAYEAMGGNKNPNGLLASRVYAMMHVAMHDALNAVQPHYETFVYADNPEGANPEVAAVSAAHRVLEISFPSKSKLLDSVLGRYLSTIPEDPSKSAGIASGVKVADALMALGYNEDDASNTEAQPARAVRQGDYKVVPPFNYVFAPFWENSKLFSISLKDQFRSVPPPALNSNEYAIALSEVQEFGTFRSKVRTADQAASAKYWYEESQNGWNRIARNVAAQRKPGLFATARLFALLNMAIADSYTAAWDSKLYYNFWRPFTAIRAAAFDGNELTNAEKDWLPGEPTPPIQDYPSSQAALGNAGASVLAYFFGDDTPFSMGSPSAIPAGTVRSFNSFTQAANENAVSGVLAGVHFRFSCQAGQEMGTKIGKWTVEHHLKPL